jgi:hypothetical protein
MQSALKRWLVVVLVILSIGTPWAWLQSAAWVNMLVKYSRQTGLRQGFSMTFDGNHPCRLCQAVKQGQAQDQREGKKRVAPDERLQLGLPPDILVLIHPAMAENLCRVVPPRSAPNYQPPSPPPRA